VVLGGLDPGTTCRLRRTYSACRSSKEATKTGAAAISWAAAGAISCSHGSLGH
jgi:hypothetical protein